MAMGWHGVHGRLRGALLVTTLMACSGGDQVAPPVPGAQPAPITLPTPTGVVAKIGPGFVTADEFASAAAATPGADQSMAIEARKEVLDQLLTEEAMVMEAVELGLVRDPKVRKVLVNLLLRQEVIGKVKNDQFTDDELREYYNSHTDDFVLPEKLQVKRILVTFGDKRSREEAEAIIKQARKQVEADPASFREVAEKISEDSYQRRGGDLGFLSRDGKPGIDSKVAEVAFSMKMGELSQPFEADGGLNLVMATNRREAVERTFEQMRGSVMRKLRTERYQELTERYIEGLRADAAVEIDDAALMAIEIKQRPGRNLLMDDPDEMDGDDDELGVEHTHRSKAPGMRQ